jgi:hypothetical protein
MSSQQTRITLGNIVAICRIYRENASRNILETDSPGIDGKFSENVFQQLRNTVHGSNLYFVDQITHTRLKSVSDSLINSIPVVSTDGRATLYVNDQTHMFGRKEM